jgi:hypothetical protein
VQVQPQPCYTQERPLPLLGPFTLALHLGSLSVFAPRRHVNIRRKSATGARSSEARRVEHGFDSYLRPTCKARWPHMPGFPHRAHAPQAFASTHRTWRPDTRNRVWLLVSTIANDFRIVLPILTGWKFAQPRPFRAFSRHRCQRTLALIILLAIGIFLARPRKSFHGARDRD